MAEKIRYELLVDGTGKAIDQILDVQSALDNLNGAGVANVARGFLAATSAVNQFKNEVKGIAKVQTPFTSRGTYSAIDLGLVPNIDIRTARPEDLATNIHELRKMRKQGIEFNKSLLRYMFGNIPSGIPKLGWNGLDYKPSTDFFWKTIYGESHDIPESDTEQRHERAEKARERFRRKWKKNNPWSDPETFSIVPVGDRSVVPRGTEYIDAEWRTASPNEAKGYKQKPPPFFRFDEGWRMFFRSNSPRSLFRNLSEMTGVAGIIGNIGMWGMAFNLVMSSIAWFGRNLKRLVDAVRNFGEVILQATESWRQLRESHFYGMSMGSLAAQWKAMMLLGGDAASASALWDRLSTDRAMIAYGGNGGRMMEAARLFGVGILGSGEYGYATNDEFMRNVAIEMSKSSKSRQKALANVLGLNAYQFWLLSNGVDFYDEKTNWMTKRGRFREWVYGDRDKGREIFSEEYTRKSLAFEESLGKLSIAFKELGGLLGELLLPILSSVIDFVSNIVQAISEVLEYIKQLASAVENFINSNDILRYLFGAYDEAMGDVENTPTAESIRARGNAITNNSENRSVVININDISLNSLGLDNNATPDDIGGAILRLFNNVGDKFITERR